MLTIHCTVPVLCVRRNMVYALKEVSIRGDFRTTLEYLITLMETGDFEANQFDTGWLDKLIADKVKVQSVVCVHREGACPVAVFACAVDECLSSFPLQSERPDTITGVICGSLCIADEAIRKRFADYQAYLER